MLVYVHIVGALYVPLADLTLLHVLKVNNCEFEPCFVQSCDIHLNWYKYDTQNFVSPSLIYDVDHGVKYSSKAFLVNCDGIPCL